MTIPLTDDILTETLKEFERNGRSQNKTATSLGIARSTLQTRLARATSQGLGEHFVSKLSAPTGLEVAGTSTLYGPSGEIKGQWVRTKGEDLAAGLEIIKEAFGDYKPNLIKLERFNKEKLIGLHTVYPIADLHYGMYSWKEETGDDYDTDIASTTLTTAFTELVARSPNSDVGIVLNLGDFFHADNDENRTRKSGNKLDMDTRYARVLRGGVHLAINIVRMAKEKHKYVLVKGIAGNHDPYGSLALTTALAAYFEQDPQVVVDVEADPVWCYRFGRTLLTAAHGDMVKPVDMPKVIAANHGRAWGASTWRYAYLGHTHQMLAFESGGMQVEVFRTVAPKDAWQSQMGYHARRSLVSITHDQERGEIDRKTVNIESRRGE